MKTYLIKFVPISDSKANQCYRNVLNDIKENYLADSTILPQTPNHSFTNKHKV